MEEKIETKTMASAITENTTAVELCYLDNRHANFNRYAEIFRRPAVRNIHAPTIS